MKALVWSRFRSASPSLLLLLLLAAVSANAADLRIERAALHQIEDGPPIDASIYFMPGETAYLSLRASGFETKEKDDEFRSVSLQFRIEVLDPYQIAAIPPHSGVVDTVVRKEDKDWTPKVRAEIKLPDFAARGKYRVLLWIKDQQSKGEAKQELSFTVQGRDDAPATELTVRNFGFYRENDRRPLTQAVYQVGAEVWTRFDITGYQMSPAPKNGFAIEYGVMVNGPDGKAVISQPNAATETYENFYPRRFVQAGFRLDLPKNGLRGHRELILEVRDKSNGRKLELRQEFEVE